VSVLAHNGHELHGTSAVDLEACGKNLIVAALPMLAYHRSSVLFPATFVDAGSFSIASPASRFVSSEMRAATANSPTIDAGLGQIR
jgi:hypothetical protein